jgi:hypothetical protein
MPTYVNNLQGEHVWIHFLKEKKINWFTLLNGDGTTANKQLINMILVPLFCCLFTLPNTDKKCSHRQRYLGQCRGTNYFRCRIFVHMYIHTYIHTYILPLKPCSRCYETDQGKLINFPRLAHNYKCLSKHVGTSYDINLQRQRCKKFQRN